jgi:rod shape-determining protein MreD
MNQQVTFINYALSFIVHLVVQILFVHNLELFGLAFCFLYINFILILPLHTNRNVLLVSAFGLGFLMDGFYDTLGIHAFASVLIAYLRPFLISSIGSKVEITELNIQNTGLYWFMTYSFILIFIHHLTIFFFQQFNVKMFLDTLIRVISSSLFTLLAVILIQYLFYSNTKNAR